MDMIRNMLEGWPGRIFLLVLLGCAALIPLTIYAAFKEARAWATFASEHDCKVVGQMSGSTSTGTGVGVMANGQVGTVTTTSTTPDKTGYACNDGVTYWR